MEKQNLTYSFNLRPDILAAVLVEQGICPLGDIAIQPDSKSPSGYLTEITNVSRPRRKQGWRINVKTHSTHRQELLQQLEHRSPYHELLSLFEEQIGQTQTEILIEERTHVLGASDWMTEIYELPNFLTTEQLRAMATFMPWASTIREDLELIERCCSTIIGQAVEIKPTVPKEQHIDGMFVGSWTTGHNDCVGGECLSSKPCYQVTIGPISVSELPTFIPSSQTRRFIEEILLPTFLPKGSDYTIYVLPEEKEKKFIISDVYHTALLGMNSCIAP